MVKAYHFKIDEQSFGSGPPDVCWDSACSSECCKLAIIGERKAEFLKTCWICKKLLGSFLLSDAASTTVPNIVGVIPDAVDTCAPLQLFDMAA